MKTIRNAFRITLSAAPTPCDHQNTAIAAANCADVRSAASTATEGLSTNTSTIVTARTSTVSTGCSASTLGP